MSKNLWITLGVMVVSLVAATAAVVGLFSTKILVLVIATAFLGAAMVLSGNTRLFILYCLIFLAPLNIKKDFIYLAHLAGASSFEFHISDPFLLVLVIYLVRDLIRGNSRPFRFPPALLLWVTLMAGGVVSILFNPMPLPPAHEVFRMARWLLWMLVLINEVVRRQQFLHVAYALLVAAAFQTFFAYLEVAGITFGLENYGQMSKQGIENLGSVTLKGDRSVHRIGGIMIHPNVLGAYLAMHSGIALALLFTPIRWLLKLIIAALFISFIPIIVLTLSRAAWVDLAVVVFGVTLLTYTNQYARLHYTVLRTAILIGIVIIGVAFSGKIITRLTQSAPGAVDTRWDLIDTARKMIAVRPWFGFGLNTITFYQPPYTKQGGVTKMTILYGKPGNWPVVHNSYLLVLVEQGIVGFAIWMLLHVVIIVTGFRNLRLRDPTLHALNVGLLAGYCAIMIDSLVSFFDRLQQGVLIWTFAALIFAIRYWRRENELNAGILNVNSVIDQQHISSSIDVGRRGNFLHGTSSQEWLPSRTHAGFRRFKLPPATKADGFE